MIDRASRPLVLTEAGRLIFDQAVQVVERFEDLRVLAGRMRAARPRILRIGFVASALYGRLPDVLRRYRAEQSQVDLSMHELFSLEQVAALKEGRIDVGFGRIPFEEPTVERRFLHSESLIVALPTDHALSVAAVDPSLAEIAAGDIIIYPRTPRPSYADQVLGAFRSRGLRPASVMEVRELQTALGLVAAGLGVCIVPAAVARLRRDNVVYRTLRDADLTSPLIISIRVGDRSPEVGHMVRLADAMYADT